MEEYTYEDFLREDSRLGLMYADFLEDENQKYVGIDAFLEEHASAEYKTMLREEKKKIEELHEKGIMRDYMPY
ncbi:MAG: hypothetical protein ACOYCA_05810 [Eggerthellaceae bacterium]|jgi:hypothetical protein